MRHGGGGGRFAAAGCGSDSHRGGPRKARKDVSLIVLGCIALSFGLVLQGCDSSYFDEPDEVVAEDAGWQAKKLIHTPLHEYKCVAKTLKDELDKMTIAYNNEAATATWGSHAVGQHQHLTRVFPTKPFDNFVIDKASGYLNKQRVFCRIRHYFPDLPQKEMNEMMLDHVQMAVSQIIEYIGNRQGQWKVARENTDKLKAMKDVYGHEDLPDDDFKALQDAVLPFEVEYIRVVLHSIETFASDAGGNCLQQFFEDFLKAEQCAWPQNQTENTEL